MLLSWGFRSSGAHISLRVHTLLLMTITIGQCCSQHSSLLPAISLYSVWQRRGVKRRGREGGREWVNGAGCPDGHEDETM
ncbi:hypothetical protein GGR56DRAFT_618506 [Xylariaceae sp. FL0804]|nr:hypothetical protein GGR56DRAFT_618506 [Xylariaceae sp. FL0804]